MHFRLFFTLLLFCVAEIGAGQSYFLNGNAQALGNSCYRITSATTYQIGTVWYATQLDLSAPFSIDFYMNFGANDDNGADGMVFVLQTMGTSAIGVTGAGMGFQGFNPSFGIEFDTHPNNANTDPSNNLNDPNMDHSAFFINGTVNHNSAGQLIGPVSISASSNNVEDGVDHKVRITWEPVSQVVTMYFDCVQRLSNTVDLSSILGTDQVYWGFTGSTGGLFNVQTVCLANTIAGQTQEYTICPNGGIQIEASGVGASAWSWSPTTGLSDATIANPQASPDVTTTYVVTYNDLCNQPVYDTVIVHVDVSPDLNAGADFELCAGTNAVLNGSCTQPFFAWTTPDGSFVSGNNTLSPTIGSTGTYVLTANTSAGCTFQDEVHVTSAPMPTIEVLADVSFCPGESIPIQPQFTGDAIQWQDGSAEVDYIISSPGNYEVTVFQGDCQVSSTFQATYAADVPLIDLGNDVEICENAPLTLDAGVAVQWSTGVNAEQIEVAASGLYWCHWEENGCTADDSIQVNVDAYHAPQLGEDRYLCQGDSLYLISAFEGLWSNGNLGDTSLISSAGEYSIVVENGVCIARDTVMVSALGLPSVDLGADMVLCQGKTKVLSAVGANNMAFQWSTGSTSSFIECTANGEYSVEVSNICGAMRDSIKLTFEECAAYLYVPNSFTPNGDGVNDAWYVKGYNISAIEILIYDRWGDPIFSSHSLSQGWMGNVHGGDHFAEDGIYIYHIKYLPENALEAQELRGYVSILR